MIHRHSVRYGESLVACASNPPNALTCNPTTRYAERAKKIQNKAEKQSDSAEVAKLKEIIAKLRAGEQVDADDEGEAVTLAKEEDYKGDSTGEASALEAD